MNVRDETDNDESENSVYIFEAFDGNFHQIILKSPVLDLDEMKATDGDFECAGDEVLVESTPPASPDMAARLAQPSQVAGSGASASTGAGGSSPNGSAGAGAVRSLGDALIVIPEMTGSIQLQHAIHQVTSTVVEVNGDSSGQSSPTAAEAQHTYITVATRNAWPVRVKAETVEIEFDNDQSDGGNAVNYHVQYVEPQEIYTQGHQGHLESLRSYPVYGVTTVGANGAAASAGGGGDSAAWGGADSADYAAYGVVVAGDEASAPASPATPTGAPQPPRMPPATVQWLLDNYETAEGVSLPRSTLYSHYIRHCASHRLDPVNAASFGKLIRSVFIGLRTRRLGTRGNSKYHYYGIRAKASSGELSPPHIDAEDKDDDATTLEPRPSSELGSALLPVGTAGVAHRQFLGTVTPPEPPELRLDEAIDTTDIPQDAVHALRSHHRQHGAEFLEAVAALDTAGVERARRAFWRRLPAPLCRRTMARLGARRDVADWLRRAELQLYQKAVELLLPDVLRPIPPQLTQAIRNFAKSLESALASGAGGSGGAPPAAAKAHAAAAAALAAALRRYTSLNHLAQAARAVLTNHHQIQQMLADLNRVDFRVVREQAAWACSCGAGQQAQRLEQDFKHTLGRGASLEQWASWLDGCVRAALQPHERKPDFAARARRLLLDWSFYSSLVIRELTLRSAASFGSFHLIRLLYDEYVSYLIERRVAAHVDAPPIAVMQRAQTDEEDSTVSEDASRDDDADPDDPDWEWAEDEDEDDDPLEVKKIKLDDRL